MILAGDIAGTNTRLALFEVGARDPGSLASHPSRLPSVGLINDLEANANGLAALGPDEFRC